MGAEQVDDKADKDEKRHSEKEEQKDAKAAAEKDEKRDDESAESAASPVSASTPGLTDEEIEAGRRWTVRVMLMSGVNSRWVPLPVFVEFLLLLLGVRLLVAAALSFSVFAEEMEAMPLETNCFQFCILCNV
jgi:hypothetical protein